MWWTEEGWHDISHATWLEANAMYSVRMYTSIIYDWGPGHDTERTANSNSNADCLPTREYLLPNLCPLARAIECCLFLRSAYFHPAVHNGGYLTPLR